MSIQHNLITDPNIHEPKGVATASVGEVYAADGAGSGDWKKISVAELLGLSSDSGISEQLLVTDGSNGFILRRKNAYGSMCITHNTNNFVVAAASDSTLQTLGDFVQLTGTGAPFASENLENTSFSTAQIGINVTGLYRVSVWGQIAGFPNTAGTVGFRFRVPGVSWSNRTMKVRSNSGGDYGLVSASELMTLAAADAVQLFVASTHAGNLLIQNLNLTVDLVKAT